MDKFTRTYWIFWLGVLPLVYFRGNIDYEFPKFLVFLAGVNGWGVAYILKTKKTFFRVENQIDYLILAMGLVNLISWLVNGLRYNGLVGDIYRYSGLITIGSMIEWYFLSKQMKLTRDAKNKMIWWLGGGLSLLALKWPLMGNPNFIAAYLALLSINSVWSIDKLGAGIICWLTNSRSAGLAWLISGLMNINRKLLGLGLVAGIILIIIFPKKSISHFDNRLTIWSKSTEIIWNKPLWGWGPEGYETGFKSILTDKDFDLKNIRVDRAHNILLDIAVNTGIVGLFIWVGLFYCLFRAGDRDSQIFLIAFLIISGLNVININSWLLFYMTAARISVGDKLEPTTF
ncbi:MAG: O-antigen ligase family protein [Microgenomates group bacterium]